MTLQEFLEIRIALSEIIQLSYDAERRMATYGMVELRKRAREALIVLNNIVELPPKAEE